MPVLGRRGRPGASSAVAAARARPARAPRRRRRRARAPRRRPLAQRVGGRDAGAAAEVDPQRRLLDERRRRARSAARARRGRAGLPACVAPASRTWPAAYPLPLLVSAQPRRCAVSDAARAAAGCALAFVGQSTFFRACALDEHSRRLRDPLRRVPRRARRRRGCARRSTPSRRTSSSSSGPRSSRRAPSPTCARRSSASSPSRSRGATARHGRALGPRGAPARHARRSTATTSTASSPSTRSSSPPPTSSWRSGARCRSRSPTASTARSGRIAGTPRMLLRRPLDDAPRALAARRQAPLRLPARRVRDRRRGARAPARHATTITFNVHNEPYPTFENRVLLHLAAGHLVITEPLSPTHGLERGLDYVEVSYPEELTHVAATVRDVPRRLPARPRPRAPEGRAVPRLTRVAAAGPRPLRRPRGARHRSVGRRLADVPRQVVSG